MKDPGARIHDAFEGGGIVSEADFAWLVRYLKGESTHHPGAVELLDFAVVAEGMGVTALLSVRVDRFGHLSEVFAANFPVPYVMQVLNRADPNPGSIVVSISWGED